MRNININLALYSPFLVTAVSGSVVLEEKSSGYIHILRNIFQVSAFQVSAFQVSAFQVLNFCAKLSRFCFEIFWKYSLKSQKNRASLVITFINRLIFYAINFLRKVQKIFCEMFFKFLFSTNNFLRNKFSAQSSEDFLRNAFQVSVFYKQFSVLHFSAKSLQFSAFQFLDKLNVK